MKLMVDQRVLLLGLYRQGGHTIHQLASQFKVHYRTVTRLIAKADGGGDLADNLRSGRPPILTASMHHSIANYLKQDDLLSTKRVAWKLKEKGIADVSRSTAWRYLKSKEWISARPSKRPPLSDLHKTRRVEWARLHQNRNWKNVVFTDESLFKLQSNQLLWCGKTRNFINKSQYVPQLHVCGAIRSRRTVRIYFLEHGETIDSAFFL